MSYHLKVIKDHPIAFWPLDESSGSTANDISGCGNNGTYHGSPFSNILPLIAGGNSGIKITDSDYISFPITKDYYGAQVNYGLANRYTSDNDFTLEVWVSQSFQTNSEIPLLADIANRIGLYWENGDVIFRVSDTDFVRYSVPYSKKSIHLVGVYSVNAISLYLDSYLVGSKTLSRFKFTNETFDLQAGPTSILIDTFILDAPAVYRYGLSQQVIKKHYMDGNVGPLAINAVYPDNGILFTGSDANIKAVMDYSYPASKSLATFVNNDIYYDYQKQYLSFYPSESYESKTTIIEDFLIVPSQLEINTSKIEWRNDLGISVETSVDGVNYLSCINGRPIPQYSKDNFDTSGNLYIKITMSTDDASRFLPRLSFFCITFYSNRDIYADNYGDKITSVTDYYLGSLNYPILSRHAMNGIRPRHLSGFDLNTSLEIKSLEMFYTPIDSNASTIIYNEDPVETMFAWDNSGNLYKENISKLYINGVDLSSISNISGYLIEGQPHHIVIVFNTKISGILQFNYGTSTVIGVSVPLGSSNLYKNIALYENELNQAKVEEHFEIYVGKPIKTIIESAITLTELTPEYYNNDWVVVQST